FYNREVLFMENKNTIKRNSFYDLFTGYIALKIYTKNDNVQGMYHNLKKLKPFYNRKPSYHYRLAKIEYRQNKLKQALEHMNIAIQLNNKLSNQNILLFKAECLAQLKQYTNTIPCINEYISYKSDSKKALYMLANASYNLQQWKDAAKSWESYLKIAPNDSRASFKLG